ncbi:MAG: hypothetical protein LIO81_00930 [Clostridiales bacterium]|nr:hypothetical protein [Clostridiales bacterium]
MKIVESFLDAAVSNSPERLNLAPNIRTTYNGDLIKLGENEIWQEAIVFPSRQTFVDPVTMSAVFYGTATNEACLDDGSHGYPKNKKIWNNYREFNRSSSRWWYYCLRLHCTDHGAIDEVEELTVENTLIHFDVHPRDYPMRNLIFDIPVPQEDRMERDELIAVAETYFDGLDKRIEPSAVLSHPDSQRIELGEKCTNTKKSFPSMSSSFYDSKFQWHINNRSYPVVDPALGVVCAVVEFAQARPDSSPGWVCFESFKIVDGTFREILCTHKPMCLLRNW